MMKTFDEMIQELNCELCESQRYHTLGKTFIMTDPAIEGWYWYYEGEQFMVSIHDFMVKEDCVRNDTMDYSDFFMFYSSYIITGNGEYFYPYQTMSDHTVIACSATKNSSVGLLHKNSAFLSVDMYFKESMLRQYISPQYEAIEQLFVTSTASAPNPLRPLAYDILHCQMSEPAAKLFFQAKANEWLSILWECYLQQRQEKPLQRDDEEALLCVTSYINDHLTTPIRLSLLAQIATMSETKLKRLFSQRYHMSVTEYIQRKRMNIAENLLLTTTLQIQDIARAVGYKSPSKFATYYHKYKGCHPREARRRHRSP